MHCSGTKDGCVTSRKHIGMTRYTEQPVTLAIVKMPSALCIVWPKVPVTSLYFRLSPFLLCNLQNAWRSNSRRPLIVKVAASLFRNWWLDYRGLDDGEYMITVLVRRTISCPVAPLPRSERGISCMTAMKTVYGWWRSKLARTPSSNKPCLYACSLSPT